MTRIHAALFFLLLATTALADELTVRVAGRPACLDGAEVSVTPDGRKPITLKTTPDRSTYAVSLPSTLAATVEIAREGCWGDRRLWSPGDPGEVVLRTFVATTVTGEFAGAGAAGVRELRAQVYLREGGDDQGAVNSACTVEKARWRCSVPAGVLFDLRLDVPGFASSYQWDVSSAAPPEAPADLGPQPLVPGASVGGWIADPSGKPVANARVTLYPLESQTIGRQRSAATFRTARSNRRGFFQFSGLPAGPYRLVSEAPHLSPAVVAEIAPRAGEAVTLPVPVRHAEYGELVLTLDPPRDHRGRPWRVQLNESAALDPNRTPAMISKHADEDGRWSAKGLRATIHDIRVLDGNGSSMQRTTVELFDGGRSQLHLSIPRILVRGTLKAGDDPLRAEIELDNRSGRRVSVEADDEGRFEAALPAPGTWRPTVLYPPGPTPARLTAEPFVIPEITDGDAVHDVVIELPGGRLHGVVSAPDGRKGTAVVHAWRGPEMAAQQQTDDEGRFDFIGLAAGSYRVDAQSAHGSTPEPVAVALEENETRELALVTEPYGRLRGRIVTPEGRPASGAVLQLSVDGVLWERILADVRGEFDHRISGSVKTAQVIVLTHGYPAKLLVMPVTEEPLQIVLRGDGGVIRFRGGPGRISGRGVTAPVHVFKFESNRPFGGQIRIESGVYTLCPSGSPPDQCRQLEVHPSSEQEWEWGAPRRPAAGGTT